MITITGTRVGKFWEDFSKEILLGDRTRMPRNTILAIHDASLHEEVLRDIITFDKMSHPNHIRGYRFSVYGYSFSPVYLEDFHTDPLIQWTLFSPEMDRRDTVKLCQKLQEENKQLKPNNENGTEK